jgi:N utilization substance protein A
MSKSEMDLVSFLLEKTGALAKDCFEYKDNLVFLVNKEDIGKIIGESGNTINGLRKDLRKNIDIIGYNTDFDRFVENIFHPIPVLSINIKNSRIEVSVEKENIGRAIGRQGRNLERIRFILTRLYDGIQAIKVIQGKSKEPNDIK